MNQPAVLVNDDVRVPDGLRSIDFRAALLAGLIAGVIDRLLLITIHLIQGQGAWEASRLTAAIVLGPDVLSASFDLSIVLVSLLVHFGISLSYGLIIAAVVHRFGDWRRGLMIGVAMGFAIYFVNFYLIAPLAFPYILELRGPTETLFHPVFGMIAAAAYLWLKKPRVKRLDDR